MKPESSITPHESSRIASPAGLALAALGLMGIALAALSSSSISNAQAQDAAEPKYEQRWEAREFEVIDSDCFNCHETISRRLGRPARQHPTSAHYRAAVTCHECHGGNHLTFEEDEAHDYDGGFKAKFLGDGTETDIDVLANSCAQCHSTAVEKFKASKHYAEHEGVRRVTCLECHGAHDLGAGARPGVFSWTKTCADCHDLENVEDLPASFIAMTDAKDSLYKAFGDLRLRLDNEPYPEPIMEAYRELRQLGADLVHSTQAEGADETLARINEKSAEVEAKIMAELED